MALVNRTAAVAAIQELLKIKPVTTKHGGGRGSENVIDDFQGRWIRFLQRFHPLRVALPSVGGLTPVLIKTAGPRHGLSVVIFFLYLKTRP